MTGLLAITRSMDALETAQGAMANGWIFLLPSLKKTGARWPPFLVTKAVT